MEDGMEDRMEVVRVEVVVTARATVREEWTWQVRVDDPEGAALVADLRGDDPDAAADAVAELFLAEAYRRAVSLVGVTDEVDEEDRETQSVTVDGVGTRWA